MSREELIFSIRFINTIAIKQLTRWRARLKTPRVSFTSRTMKAG